MKNIYHLNGHVYIINYDPIKKGDWAYHIKLNRVEKIYHIYGEVEPYTWYKIILTTDINLLWDGIQKPYPDFLEWLVNNPICEYAIIRQDDETKKYLIYNHLPTIFHPKRNILKDLHNCEYYKMNGCVKDICTCCTSEELEEALEEYRKEYRKENVCKKQLYTILNN